MLRFIITVPVYFGLYVLLSQTQSFQRIADIYAAHGNANLTGHLIAYGALLVLSLVDAALVYYRRLPSAYGLWFFLLRVYWLGLLGVAIACGWQLVSFFTGEPMGVAVLLIPVCLMGAEIVYLAVEFVLAEVRGEER